MTSSLVALLVAAACCPHVVVHGAVWSWMLTNPAASSAAVDDSHRQHSARSISQYESAAEQPTEIKRFAPHRHHHGQSVLCVDDRNCARGLFCDRHYGQCMPHRKEGEPCRSDNHCGGHECVFGRCRKHVRKGERGSRCRHDADCGSSMCCARHHGEYICKQRLAIGHRCFVPDGGLDYTLNEICPCQEGLTCKSAGKTKTREEDFSWKPWSENEIVRCALS